MAWKITRDLLAEESARHGEDVASPGTYDNAVGVRGPRRSTVPDEKLVHPFRMLDGDDELYYEGFCDSCDDDNALGPLDDFGEPNAGCTTIQYRDAEGVWKNLN